MLRRSLLLLLCPVLAQAVPLELSHTGRLTDSVGTPISGTFVTSASLFDAAESGAVVWTMTPQPVDFVDGYYRVVLGADGQLDEADLNGADRWLQVTVDGTALLPRTPIRSVPYAIRARSVSGGPVDATSLSVGGQPVVDGSGNLALPIPYSLVSGAPTNFDPTGPAGGALTGTYPNPALAGASVDSSHLADGSVSSVDLGADSVLTSHIADGTIGAADLAANSVGTGQIADGSVGAADLAVNSVGASEIADGAVGSAELAPSSVGATQITDGSVGSAELAENSVGSTQIADGSIQHSDLAFNGGGIYQVSAGAISATPMTDGPAALINGWIVTDRMQGPHGYREFTTDVRAAPSTGSLTYTLLDMRCSGHWGGYYAEIELVTRYPRPSVRRYEYFCGNTNHTGGGNLVLTSSTTAVTPQASMTKTNLGYTGFDHSGQTMYDARLSVTQEAYVQSYARVKIYGSWGTFKAGTSFSTTSPHAVWQTWNP